MVTLITFRNSNGSRRCDAMCYDAKGDSPCACICGGRNHGAGLQIAREQSAVAAEKWLEEWSRGMRDCPDTEAHRHRALTLARRCYTCRSSRQGEVSPFQCLGCERTVDYYSCAPGYCRDCAHDPCWEPVAWSRPWPAK